jgi:UDP-N-acetyl-D-glucosamine dehydrogenase
MSFQPGPGLGGHCIPLDPYYLSWKAREYGFHTSMIESSMMINDRMPEYCVERASLILNKYKKSLNGAKILILGVAYKQDIDDYRESPALKVIDIFEKSGSAVDYYDSYVKQYKFNGRINTSLPEINAEMLKSYDLVVITSAHTNIDYDFVAENAVHVFDTKNATKNVKDKSKITLL